MQEKKIIFPDYKHSILNVINSILRYYQVETDYSGLPELDEALKKQYKNIVLIILDGMGEHILKDVSPDGFFQRSKKTVITSVCPSTTTAAMTTYYSGKPPIETGWIAMSQYFKEYGRAIEMLRRIDSYTKEPIQNVRYDVYNLVKYMPVYQQIELASPDVKGYEVNPTFCEARSKRNINADHVDLLCDAIEAICKNSERNFILGYQENPDSLLHKYGCQSEEVKKYILDAQSKIERMCQKLKGTDTLVIVCADHGHRDIQTTYSILDLEEIQDCLMMPASLESRSISFWIKEDKKEKFEKLFREKFEGEYILYTKEEFLEKKFLGEGKKHPKIDDFLGNYLAIAIGDTVIKLETYVGEEKKNKKATHCGFTPNEMEVPLILVDCK